MKIDPLVFASLLGEYQQRVDSVLNHWLPDAATEPTELHQAMRYAVLAPGKRVRPILVYATATALGVDISQVDGAAAAVEMIHAYSLIHDDLPAMDDDNLRRGNPTCHIKFNEATAILAGDALQALAFYILSHDPQMIADHAVRLQMIEKLSLFSGSLGMAGGQIMDLAAVDRMLCIAELETIHRHKTGALIRTCIQFAALSTDRLSDEERAALDCYADAIGLAFQIQDDILDVVGQTAELGKQQGADSRQKKPTFPSVIGIDASRKKMAELHRQALNALLIFNEEADLLRYISAWFAERSY